MVGERNLTFAHGPMTISPIARALILHPSVHLCLVFFHVSSHCVSWCCTLRSLMGLVRSRHALLQETLQATGQTSCSSWLTTRGSRTTAVTVIPIHAHPNIDGLARDGTRFTQFYVTGITCCPSRTGFMTSQWPASFKTYPADGGFGDQVTITDLLHRAGYATGHFGKWHIGPEESAKAGTYGIDVVRSEHGRMKKDGMRGRDARIYDDAIRFIEQHREQPFYINVWSHISHYRIDPPESYVARFADLKVDPQLFAEPMRAKFAACRAAGGDIDLHMRRYLADIHSMDEDIGRLLDCLDNLGLRDNTIVVFSSDQGPAAIAEDADVSRRDAMGYTGIYRGGKHGMEEGGVRVPFLIRWPNQIPAGRVDSDSVISAIDWLPTLCQLCDVPIDAHAFEGEMFLSHGWVSKRMYVKNRCCGKRAQLEARQQSAMVNGNCFIQFENVAS